MRDLGINQCKTQEKDYGGEEARVDADECDKEIAKEMAMDKMTKAKADKDENPSTQVPESSAIMPENQHKSRDGRWR